MKNSTSVSTTTNTSNKFLILVCAFIALFIFGSRINASGMNGNKTTTIEKEAKEVSSDSSFEIKIYDNKTPIPAGSLIWIKGLAAKKVDPSGRIYLTSQDMETLSNMWEEQVSFIYKNKNNEMKVFNLSHPVIPPSNIYFK